MKKNSKRQIRNYEKYAMYNKKSIMGCWLKMVEQIDVKRMMVTCYLYEDIYNVINKPRKTVYYLPERVKRHDYMVNIF